MTVLISLVPTSIDMLLNHLMLLFTKRKQLPQHHPLVKEQMKSSHRHPLSIAASLTLVASCQSAP